MTEVAAYCNLCGTKIEPTSKFCSHCGKPLSLAAAPTAAGGGTNSSEKVRKKTNKKVIVGIVVITLIVAVGVVYAMVSNASTSNPSSRNALDDPQILIQEVGAYMYQQGWEYLNN